MNNIFKKAPKELVTDAFLYWLLTELQENPELTPHKYNFIHSLGINDISKKVEVESIRLQDKKTDLILVLKDGGRQFEVLFENKTWSTFHSKQLERYIQYFPNCHQYIYLKLAYIDYQERTYAENLGYKVIGAEDLYKGLTPIKDSSQIISQYFQYIKREFIEYPEEFVRRMKNNEHEVYEERQPQRKFLSDLHQNLSDPHQNLKLENLYFKSGTNRGGTPWTQLDIAKSNWCYGEKHEYLFWRIDKRSGRYYIRLNQYSDIKEEYRDLKLENLKVYRKKFKEIASQKDIKLGTPSNRGIKESEVGIMFFDNNEFSKLIEKLTSLSLEIAKFYISIYHATSADSKNNMADYRR